MNSETIVYCVVALLLGMLLANMLKNVCGCKTIEGATFMGVPTNKLGDSNCWFGDCRDGSQGETLGTRINKDKQYAVSLFKDL